MVSKYGGVAVSKYGGVSVDQTIEPPAEPIEQPRKEFSFSNMARNAPQSALDLASNTASFVTKPDESSTSMKNIFKGLSSKLTEKVHGMVPAEYWDTPYYKQSQKVSNILADLGFPVDRLPDSKEEMTYKDAEIADKIFQGFADRYGSTEAALETLEKDPFGALADTVGVAAGAGGLVNKVSSLGKKGLGKINETKLYEEAAKFSTAKFDKRARGDMADNLLDEKITLDSAGLDRIDDIISTTNSSIDELIASVDKGNVKIPKVVVLKDVEKLRKDVTGQLDAAKDRKIIDDVVDGFIDEIKVSGDSFTLAKLQEFKKKAYKKITNWDPNKSNVDKMKDRVYKAISLAGKDVIENIVPQAKGLNARQGKLINAKKPVSQSASRIENLNKIGLDALIKPAAGELITSSLGVPGVGTAAGLIAHILGRPKMKAGIALKLRELKNSKPPIPNDKIVAAMIAAYPQMLSEDQEKPSDRNNSPISQTPMP